MHCKKYSGFKSLIKKRDVGSAYIDLLIKIIIIVVFIAFFIQLPAPFLKAQNLSYICKSTVRAIETSGELNNDVKSLINDLKDVTHLEPMIEYHGLSSGRVQLRQKFSVSMTVIHEIKLLDWYNTPIKFSIPITKTVRGIGEVYWK